MKMINIILFSLLINISFMSNEKINNNSDYSYNDNGRIIIPDENIIAKLPSDGGDLWNRLIFESSPYLLQHAANPVDWYPWSDEAFKIAKELNKPIFLSIGYTTCHWCHVMEHESFEDEEVAKLMNDTFISIKVDREERPDIDNVYIEITQELAGRGGWPMTVIMSPNKKPFFAGTYFPKKSIPRYNRPGMLDLVPQIKELWTLKQDSLLVSANKIVSQIQNQYLIETSNQSVLKKTVLEDSFKSFNNRFDEIYGGFSGSRNKFPKPHDYSFLARYYLKTKNSRALEIVNKSLYEMKKGGIYDQIGFGFHRYSTDKQWLVPHFEKMLYDQAMLIHAYLDAYQINNDVYFKMTIDEICEYVLRDMTDESGGFYSAEDADSQGEEGLFYIWNTKELNSFLTEEEYAFISPILNIKENGNSIVERQKTNILHFTSNWNELIVSSDLREEEFYEKYHSIRKKIFNYRDKRVHPQKDDKILTDWNGLMISALARASVVLDNDQYLFAAQKSADFIINNLIAKDGGLLKRYRNGQSGINGMIEDYAFFIWGLIEIYQANFNSNYIELAANLSDYQIEHFWDFENQGFYFTSDLSESLIIKNKEIYDGAIPSGNSVSAYNFIRLGRILSRYDYEEITLDIIDAFSSQLNRYSSGSTMLLHAIDFLEGPSFEVIVIGEKKKSQHILNYIQKHQQRNKVIIYNQAKSKLFNFLDLYPSGEKNSPLVYVCQNYSCKLPTDDLNKINQMLR